MDKMKQPRQPPRPVSFKDLSADSALIGDGESSDFCETLLGKADKGLRYSMPCCDRLSAAASSILSMSLPLEVMVTSQLALSPLALSSALQGIFVGRGESFSSAYSVLIWSVDAEPETPTHLSSMKHS